MIDRIDRIDHIVITVASVDATCAFYTSCLGMIRVDTAGRPTALHFGNQKINVHQVDRTFDPKAAQPTRGSADFCLVSAVPLEQVLSTLADQGVSVELGPIERQGACGTMESVYFRDPDGNLVEVSRYPADDGR
jgi:catechol 2,3-dioxygenase-like lactoylglutathione lyase family enzyme